MGKDRGRRAGAARAVPDALGPLAQVAGLDVAIRYEPGTGALGGDWYNTAVQPDGSLVVVVGDVVGHGVAASATMVRLHQLIADLLRTATPLHRVFSTATEMVEGDPTVLATGLLLHVDPRRRRLGYHNAGHPWALIRYPNGEVIRLDAPSHPLIGVPAEPHPMTYVDLPTETLVLAYTDGLVERAGSSIVERIDRLTDVLAKIDADAGLDEALTQIVTAARRPDEHGEPLDDDVAAVLIRG